MIDYREVLEKIRQGLLLFRDKDGDGLLHSLVKYEKKANISTEPAEALLSKYPHLIDEKNKEGLTPPELLDTYQLHSQPSNRPLRQLFLRYMGQTSYREDFEKTVHMSFIEQLWKEDFQAGGYRVISSSESDSVLKSPVLLFFSGRGNYALPLINGFGRKIRKTLGFFEQKEHYIPTVSVRYPGNNRDLCNDWLVSHQKSSKEVDSDHPTKYIHPFVERYLRPLYLSGGRKRSLSDAMKNMRRLNLIGYSYGSSVIQMMAEYLTEDMIDNGFKEKEVSKIQSQVLTFHIAPDLNQFHYRNYFRSYHILNTQDDVVFEGLKGFIPSMEGEKRDLVLTSFAKQRNQRILIVNTLANNTENTPHHINTYCNPVNDAQRIALTWGQSVIFNGINNSLQNKRDSQFIPLPVDLESIPEKLLSVRKMPCKTLIKRAKYNCGLSLARLPVKKRSRQYE